MAEKQKRPPTRVVTGKVRLSYVKFAEPEADDNGNETYRCQVLIPKKDKDTLQRCKVAVQQATLKFAKGDKAKAQKLLKHPKWHKPLRDPVAEDLEGEQYEGCVFLSAKSKDQPAMLLKNGTRVEKARDILKHFYSGVYVNASLSFYPFDTKGNKGVAVAINSVIFNSEGERLDGRVDAADELSEFIDEDDTSALDDADGFDDDDDIDDDDLGLDGDDADEDEDDFDLEL